MRPPSEIEEDFSVEEVDLILFEGEFTLCDDEPYDFRRYSEFSIFIDAQDNDILHWNWTRGRELSEKTEDEFIANNKPYLQKYRKYTNPARNVASYLIVKDENHRYTLQK